MTHPLDLYARIAALPLVELEPGASPEIVTLSSEARQARQSPQAAVAKDTTTSRAGLLLISVIALLAGALAVPACLALGCPEAALLGLGLAGAGVVGLTEGGRT